MLTSVILALALQDEAVVTGVRAAAIPLKSVVAGSGFEDLAAFDKSLSGVEVVAMGEPTHGSREVFQFKHRMFEYLVEKHGYSVFALESSMPDTVAMDRYVLYGEGTPDHAVQQQGFWTWSTEEVVELVKWMRAYNLDPKHIKKLRVVGIDMQNQATATVYLQKALKGFEGEPDDAEFWESVSWTTPTPEQQKRIDEILTKYAPEVRKRDGEEAERMFKQVGVVLQQAIENNKPQEFYELQPRVLPYISEVVSSASDLLKSTEGIEGDAKKGLETLARIASGEEFLKEEDVPSLRSQARALRAFANGRQEFVRASTVVQYLAAFLENRDRLLENYRDKCMADNLEWVRKTYLPGEKVMVWAHNYHVARMFAGDKPNMLGSHMEQRIGDKYFPIGFSFYEGAFQAIGQSAPLQEWSVGPAKAGSMDAMLQKQGSPHFLLEFSRLDGPAKEWFGKLQTTRNYGAVNNPNTPDAFYGSIVPSDLYRAIVFISKTTRARPIVRQDVFLPLH